MSKPLIRHISVLYDEPDPTTYRGVEYGNVGQKPYKVMNTGNPAVDYMVATLTMMREADPESAPIMCSSSVDHFGMDGGAIKYNPDDLTPKEIAAIKAIVSPDR